MTISKTAIWATTGIVGGGAIAGVTYAAVAAPATAASDAATPVDSVFAAAGQPGPGAGPMAGGRLGRHGLFNRLEHGQLTLRTRNGDETVDIQHGTVTAVSPTSITVKSLDGYQHSYDVTSATRVRADRTKSTIAAVHTGDDVLVVGTAGDALRILDRG